MHFLNVNTLISAYQNMFSTCSTRLQVKCKIYSTSYQQTPAFPSLDLLSSACQNVIDLQAPIYTFLRNGQCIAKCSTYLETFRNSARLQVYAKCLLKVQIVYYQQFIESNKKHAGLFGQSYT